MNDDNRPPWARMRQDIERMGGAWPPPGTREVECAVSVPLPARDNEKLARMLLKRRKLMSAITNGRTLCRAEVRDQLMELNERINAYVTSTSNT
jgi:thiamine pyrophosphate-dependent acetolactate synthase large subunit-like protein